MPAALTLNNIPQDLLTRLQEAAQLNKHSVEEEILDCLRKALMPIATTEELISRTIQLRQQFVCEADRLADVVRRLEEGKPCLL
jgi:plasmid stability protein